LRKKLFFYAILVIASIFGVYFLGTRIIGVIGTILVFLGLKEAKGYKRAKKNIDKAGEDIEAKKHDADSALDFYNDFFSGDG